MPDVGKQGHLMSTQSLTVETIVKDAIELAASEAAVEISRDFVRKLFDGIIRVGGRQPSARELVDTALPLWRVAAAGRTRGSAIEGSGGPYAERLRRALSPGTGLRADLVEAYVDAFPASYRATFTPEEAAIDVAKVEMVRHGDDIAVALTSRDDGELRLKTYRRGQPVALSDVLPMLENLGLYVVNEVPFEVHVLGSSGPVWLQDFQARRSDQGAVDLTYAGPLNRPGFAGG